MRAVRSCEIKIVSAGFDEMKEMLTHSQGLFNDTSKQLRMEERIGNENPNGESCVQNQETNLS